MTHQAAVGRASGSSALVQEPNPLQASVAVEIKFAEKLLRFTYSPATDVFERIDSWTVPSSAVRDRWEIRQAGREISAVGSQCSIRIAFEDEPSLQAFVDDCWTVLVDIATTAASESSGVLAWVGKRGANLWFLSIKCSDLGAWHGMAALRRVQTSALEIVSSEPFAAFARFPTRANARHVFDFVTSSESGLRIPAGFPTFQPLGIAPSASLVRATIKIDRGNEWFLLMPIEIEGRVSADWITTGKTFIRASAERRQVERELSDLANVLKHTVVIINTYPHFDEGCAEATRAVVEILKLLEHVDLQPNDGVGGLRWYLNPASSTVERILRDEATRYVVADFHVEDGRWHTGGGGTVSVESFLPGALAHVRLLRVFHCNSVFDPARLDSLGDSIASNLLRAGAGRVEGSCLRESYVSFLEEVVRIACKGGMSQVFAAKCFEADRSPSSLLAWYEQSIASIES